MRAYISKKWLLFQSSLLLVVQRSIRAKLREILLILAKEKTQFYQEKKS